MRLIVQSATFGDRTYYIAFDTTLGWIATCGSYEFVDAHLHQLLARIGAVLETELRD
jgi:hypothetical protein